MTQPRIGALIALAVALCLATPAAAKFDPAGTAFGFHLRTRWGQRIDGTFPQYSGEVRRLAEDQRQVHLMLDADAVQLAGSDRYTRMARGPTFFDAARHPQITFVSEPFPVALLARGGALRGTLTLRGVSRAEAFEVLPAPCARPGHDCDVIAHGSVRRDHYGLDGLQSLLGNRVHFSLRVRLADDS